MNKIVKEENGAQPYAVYWVKDKQKPIWRAAFSTESKAQDWIDKYGDRPVVDLLKD